MIRTFIALPTSTETQHAIHRIQQGLETCQADVKWEEPSKYHITLKFIGDIDEGTIPSLADALAAELRDTRSFDLSYSGLGVFPHPGDPRVVWVGVQEPMQTLALQSRVEAAGRHLGLPTEHRRFHPHITLGRVKGQRNRARLLEGIKTGTFEPISAFCDTIQIMKSDLRPGGSLYTVLKTITLLS